MKRYEDPKWTTTQAVSLDHTDAWAFQHLGNTQLGQGDLDGAAELLDAAADRLAPFHVKREFLGCHLMMLQQVGPTANGAR